MTIKGEGHFFDGASSKAHAIEVSYNSTNQLIILQLNDRCIEWHTENCTIQVVKGKLEVHFDASTAYFESQDTQLAQALEKTAPTIKSKNVYHRLIHAGFKIHMAILASIIGFLAILLIFVLPYFAEKAVVLIPESFDDEIGQSVYNDMLLSETVDQESTHLVQTFCDQLQLQNRKKIHITVVRSSTVNAFALPSGHVVIYTGILKEMEEYPELAALIGHEVSHVNQRHSMKALCKNLSTYLFVSALLGDVNGVLTIIGQNAGQLQNLSYSRKLEEEADVMGLSIVKNNHIDPNGFLDLFAALNRNSTIQMPEFLSSHPVTDKRISKLKKRMKDAKFAENSFLKNLFSKIKANVK
ncbi:MAG: M48 family metallopeptidase [Crocinitomicaceae bacterium]